MKWKWALGLAALAVAVAGWLLWVRPEAPSAKTSASVRLAWVYDMAEAGLFVAKDEGYFDEAGLDVVIHPGGFGSDPVKLVASGADDFGVAGAGNVLLARAEGVPIVAIAVEFQNTPVGFIVREESGIESFADFRGRRVGIQTGSDTDVLYRALLARNRMTAADVREVPIQFDVTPFTSGQIDVLPGYVTNQPVTLRKDGFKLRVISAESLGLAYYGNVFITSEKMLQEHPDRVCAFVEAARRGWSTALSNKDVAVESVRARSQDFEISDLSAIYDAVLPFVRQDERGSGLLSMDAGRWNATQQVLLDAGLLNKPLDLSSAYSSACFR